MWEALGATGLFALLLMFVWAVIGWEGNPSTGEDNPFKVDPIAGYIAIICTTIVYLVLLYIVYRVK